MLCEMLIEENYFYNVDWHAVKTKDNFINSYISPSVIGIQSDFYYAILRV